MDTIILNTTNGKTITIHNEGGDIQSTYIWVPIIEMVIKETLETRYIDNFGFCIHMNQTQIKKAIKRLEKVKKAKGPKFSKTLFQALIEELKPLNDPV